MNNKHIIEYFAWIARVIVVSLIFAMLFYALNRSCAWSVGF